MQYIYDPDTGLWYEVQADVNELGEVTLTTAQSGTSATPEPMPPVGGALITIEEYMIILGISTVDNYNQWLYAAYAVSDYIERYCCFSWRDTATTVPYGLKTICALMIRDQIDYANNQLNASKKSESISNYSYTLGDTVGIGSTLAQYTNSLSQYKCYSFGSFPLSADNCYQEA